MFRFFYFLGIFCLIVPTVRLPFVDLGISELFVFTALGIWIFHYLREQGQNGWGIPTHILWLPAVLILIGGLSSSFGAVHQATSLAITVKTFFVVTVWISVSILMVRRGDLLPTMSVFLFAVCVTSLVCLVDRWVGTNIGNAISGNQTFYYNRSSSTFGHPNELGYITSVALPLTLALILREVSARRRWLVIALLVGVFALGGTALFYSGSVAGWVSAVVSIGIFGLIAFLRATMQQRLVAVGGVVLLVGVGLLLLIDPTRQAQLQFLLDFNLNRATNITGPGRTELLGEAFSIIEQNPLVGAGMDQTGTGNLRGDDLVTPDWIHNTLIGGWLAGGLLVFAGLAICYGIAIISAVRALAWGYRTLDWLAVGLGASVFGWFLFDQTQPNLYHRFTWLTLAWLFALGFQVRLNRKPEPETDTMPAALQSMPAPLPRA